MTFLSATMLVLSLAITEAQSLREIAKQYGGRAETVANLEFGVASVDDIVSASDLIVHGRITGIKTHLTPDETMVVTDYSLLPTRFMKQDTRTTISTRPGSTQPLMIRRLGGTVDEGKYHYSTVATVYPAAEDFEIGEEVLLFLTFVPSEGVYYFTYGPFGAFRVRGGEVSSMSKATARLRGDEPISLATFLNKVHERTRDR